MGRKKVEMKRIEDKSSRQVTFTKRRGGLFKKAAQLSVLCDVDLAALVFSARGKLFEYSNAPSVTQIIQRYNSYYKGQVMISAGGQEAESKFADFLTSSELLEIIERQLEEPNVDRLSVNDLVLIEGQIDAALLQIRSRKTQLMLDSITALHEKEKLLKEENKRLVRKLGATGIYRNSAGQVLTGNIDRVHEHMNSCSWQPMFRLL